MEEVSIPQLARYPSPYPESTADGIGDDSGMDQTLKVSASYLFGLWRRHQADSF
jgi:hypothetical protein